MQHLLCSALLCNAEFTSIKIKRDIRCRYSFQDLNFQNIVTLKFMSRDTWSSNLLLFAGN
jgi:hypothetical protein